MTMQTVYDAKGAAIQLEPVDAKEYLESGSYFTKAPRGKAKQAEPEAAPPSGFPATRDGLNAAIAALPGEYDDPEEVVSGMRIAFGELFTADDEAKIRELVIAPTAKPSDGLKVDELKAALTAKGIEIPDGALKADLAALLDGAA
jgi:hypothetical protein